MNTARTWQRDRNDRAAVRPPARRAGVLGALVVFVVFAFAAGDLFAQAPDKEKDPAEPPEAVIVDPYTNGDAEAMKRAGVVAYPPFAWADGFGTADIDKVLGEKRIRWIETKHFRIGSTFGAFAWPDDSEKRKALQDELKQLRTTLPKVPAKPKRIDSWVRLHLYAQRAERCYADVLKLLGATDADFPAKGTGPRDGPYLGQPDKFLALLFQKKSDMARYLDRFCGTKGDTSVRFCHTKTHQMVLCMAAEGLDGFDDVALHGHFAYAVIHNLVDGYNGFHYQLPPWLTEGLAHWYSRSIPSNVPNVAILDTEAVAEDKKNDWPAKVRRRAQHEGAFFPFETMVGWDDPMKMGYHAHSQSWSRVDFLMRRDVTAVGMLLKKLKSLAPGDDKAQSAKARELSIQLVRDLFGLDPAAFDAAWRDWVQKTYPK